MCYSLDLASPAGRGGSLEEAQAFGHDKANDEQRAHTRRHLLMRAHPRLCLTCCD